MRKTSRPDAENPEWTGEEIRQARPLMDVLPQETVEAVRRYRGQRGPQKSPTKELVSLRVDREIVAAYRATGAGWQKRANEALRAYATKSGFTGGSLSRRGTTVPARGRRRPTASRERQSH
jgi:uncharacterized protein (DUF4415 family)